MTVLNAVYHDCSLCKHSAYFSITVEKLNAVGTMINTVYQMADPSGKPVVF